MRRRDRQHQDECQDHSEPDDRAVHGALRGAFIAVGTNPTFTGAGAPLRVEAHLLDFAGDLYGQRVRLWFWSRLRDELRFNGKDALIAQLHADVAATRAAAPPALPELD